jgi:hypothetical protein
LTVASVLGAVALAIYTLSANAATIASDGTLDQLYGTNGG